jgi:hypothetical protein
MLPFQRAPPGSRKEFQKWPSGWSPGHWPRPTQQSPGIPAQNTEEFVTVSMLNLRRVTVQYNDETGHTKRPQLYFSNRKRT